MEIRTRNFAITTCQNTRPHHTRAKSAPSAARSTTNRLQDCLPCASVVASSVVVFSSDAVPSGVVFGEGCPQLISGLGERHKLPQWGLGQSPGRKRILAYFEVYILHLYADALISSNGVPCHIWGQGRGLGGNCPQPQRKTASAGRTPWYLATDVQLIRNCSRHNLRSDMLRITYTYHISMTGAYLPSYVGCGTVCQQTIHDLRYNSVNSGNSKQ